MKKSDLRDGMVIEMEDESRGIIINNSILYTRLSDSLDDFTEDLLYKNDGKYRINKIYKIIKRTNYISEIFKIENLKLIWERDKEIDWNKVPEWTKVQAKYRIEDEYVNRYFVEYQKENEFPFCCSCIVRDEFTDINPITTNWQYCRIHPSVEVKEEWYK